MWVTLQCSFLFLSDEVGRSSVAVIDLLIETSNEAPTELRVWSLGH